METKQSHNALYMPPVIPDRARSRVDRAKIVDYLLSTTHPDGRAKAEFFLRFGFRAERWHELGDALREVGASNPVASLVETAYGLRYTVDGPVRAPDGRAPRVRTVWIVEPGEVSSRLITAHPL